MMELSNLKARGPFHVVLWNDSHSAAVSRPSANGQLSASSMPKPGPSPAISSLERGSPA